MTAGESLPGVSERDGAFDLSVDILIIGAGACGLTAALAAREAVGEDAEILVLERDRSPSGSTSLSSGFIPAAGTAMQRAAGVTDTPELLAADIQAKAHGSAYGPLVGRVAAESGPAITWLHEKHGLPFILIDGFLYPGHSVLRMHAMPERTGAALQAALLGAATNAGLDIATGLQVDTLFTDKDRRITGVSALAHDGSRQDVGCDCLILACNGYGGNGALVRQHIPEMADALYFGHDGNQGEAVIWGEALGACLADMSGYQGHGSVAHPHGALISWALMMEGGILVNAAGARFSNEHDGYSEQAPRVNSQPNQCAYVLIDDRLLALARDFPDFCGAEDAGALISAASASDMETRLGFDAGALAATLDQMASAQAGKTPDSFGRDFTTKPPLQTPLHAIRVTGALFHTQGGLDINLDAEVLDRNGQPLGNLLAAGGAARGVSGPDVSGYLSGNGLLTAVTLGRIAGHRAGILATTSQA
jgi:fumarate reductase flavoprotein subunit